MAMSADGHPLIEQLDHSLQKRGVRLSRDARAAILEEYSQRLDRSRDPTDQLRGWETNIDRYVALLEMLAEQKRRFRGVAPEGDILLEPEDVVASFRTCARLCPPPE